MLQLQESWSCSIQLSLQPGSKFLGAKAAGISQTATFRLARVNLLLGSMQSVLAPLSSLSVARYAGRGCSAYAICFLYDSAMPAAPRLMLSTKCSTAGGG